MPSSKLWDGVSHKDPKDFWLQQGSWVQAKEIYLREEYFVDGDPAPRYRWTKFWWQTPTATPTIVSIGQGTGSYDVRCEVGSYSATYPSYQVHFELIRTSDLAVIADHVSNAGETVHTFTFTSAWSGTEVYFRARYVDQGKYGPFSSNSATYIIGGGLG